VVVETGSRLVERLGGRTLDAVVVEDGNGQRIKRSVCGVFVMIGADPSTDWLGDAVRLDDRRFVLTTAAAVADGVVGSQFATSLPGVFAVGDVRSNSVKRVASAVGEGAQAISAVHSFLAATGHRVSHAHPR
jgi:thioredoxin reductase (NADPH)